MANEYVDTIDGLLTMIYRKLNSNKLKGICEFCLVHHRTQHLANLRVRGLELR